MLLYFRCHVYLAVQCLIMLLLLLLLLLNYIGVYMGHACVCVCVSTRPRLGVIDPTEEDVGK
jgi:hypothetical protein